MARRRLKAVVFESNTVILVPSLSARLMLTSGLLGGAVWPSGVSYTLNWLEVINAIFSLLIKMHGFFKKVDSYGKSALAAAGAAHTMYQVGKTAYQFGRAAVPVIAGLL